MGYADAMARIAQIQSLIGVSPSQPISTTGSSSRTSTDTSTSTSTSGFQAALSAALSGADGSTSNSLKDALKALGQGGVSATGQASATTTSAPTSALGLAEPPATRAEAIARSQQYAGTHTALAPEQLKAVLARQGFSGEALHIAWALAMRESNGQPGAIGHVNPNGTRDHGLFQVNDIHLGRSLDPAVMYDPDSNAAAAYKMSSHGTDFSAWGIGTTGWAGHLMRTLPTTYAQLNAAYQKWYDRYPG
jgi:hypothetical protein